MRKDEIITVLDLFELQQHNDITDAANQAPSQADHIAGIVSNLRAAVNRLNSDPDDEYFQKLDSIMLQLSSAIGDFIGASIALERTIQACIRQSSDLTVL